MTFNNFLSFLKRKLWHNSQIKLEIKRDADQEELISVEIIKDETNNS